MRFNKILIVHSEKPTEKHKNAIQETQRLVKAMSTEYEVIGYNQMSSSYFQNQDLFITIGGDGTFIRAAQCIRGKSPILGINSEPEFSEGALTSIMYDKLGELESILKGEYALIERPRARVKRNGQLIKELALNEVYIGTESQFHTSRYIIRLNGSQEEHRSSGALVVTGSGSNAWYKSAGGTPFPYNEKKLKMLIREPFQSRIFNPKILEAEIQEKEKIEFESLRENGGVIAIDSNATYPFNSGDIIEVRLSKQPLNVIIKNEKQ